MTDLAQAARLGLSGGAAAELLGGAPERGARALRRRLARAAPAARRADPARPRRRATTRCRSTFSLEFHAAAVAAGDTCELVVRERDGHFEHIDPASAAWATVTRWLHGPLTRAHALELDRADPLAAFRDRFELGDGDRIYLDGNSLGRLAARRPPGAPGDRGRVGHAARDRLARLGRPAPAGSATCSARRRSGAGPGQVLACDSTTVNLYKLAGAVLAVRPGAIVVTDATTSPPTATCSRASPRRTGASCACSSATRSPGPTPDAVAAAAEGAALVVLSHVDYRSGALADMAGDHRAPCRPRARSCCGTCATRPARSRSALDAAGADLAVGCTYKYLNAGPGSPAFLYVAERHQDALRSPIQGWFSQADQFAMGPRYEPVAGIGRFLAGTPPVLGLAAVRAGGRDAAPRRASARCGRRRPR